VNIVLWIIAILLALRFRRGRPDQDQPAEGEALAEDALGRRLLRERG